MTKHVMLDLETLGLTPGHGIVEIGAVAFNFNNEVTAEFNHLIRPSSNKMFNLKFDEKTLQFWHQQPREEFERVMLDGTDKESISVILQRFYHWFEAIGAKYIWSHGAGFDVPIIEAAFNAVGITRFPWKYSDVRDTRTMYWLAGIDTKEVSFEGVKHRALHDAMHQIKCLRISMDKLADDFYIEGLDI